MRSISEVFGHAPFAIQTHQHPTIGTVRTVRSPIGLDGAHPTASSAPPLLGQHSEEVLAELGYEGERLAALLAGPCSTS